MKAKLILLLVVTMAGLLLFSGVTFAAGPSGGDNSDAESCSEEQIREDPSNCPGSWASSEDMTREHRDALSKDSGSDESQGLFGCDFETKGDYPHNSRRPPGYVSVHGWWIDNSDEDDPCPTYADVTVTLQGYWCFIPGVDCLWVTLDSKRERIKEGGGAGRRVNAREPCATDTTTLYLNIVDVDLVDEADWIDTYEVTADVDCRPAD